MRLSTPSSSRMQPRTLPCRRHVRDDYRQDYGSKHHVDVGADSRSGRAIQDRKAIVGSIGKCLAIGGLALVGCQHHQAAAATCKSYGAPRALKPITNAA